MVADYNEGGSRPTDEMLLEAAGRIEPELLSAHLLQELERRLKPKIRLRGRPGRARTKLGERVMAIKNLDCDDVPQAYLTALTEPLKSGGALGELERSMRAYVNLPR